MFLSVRYINCLNEFCNSKWVWKMILRLWAPHFGQYTNMLQLLKSFPLRWVINSGNQLICSACVYAWNSTSKIQILNINLNYRKQNKAKPNQTKPNKTTLNKITQSHTKPMNINKSKDRFKNEKYQRLKVLMNCITNNFNYLKV